MISVLLEFFKNKFIVCVCVREREREREIERARESAGEPGGRGRESKSNAGFALSGWNPAGWGAGLELTNREIM